uniref:Uncharacterized protein n=1 Tax=Banana bunchy top virus TaxID=12585 RepID=Q65380_BBTV|nr:unknown [Banana bunchy top virus]
MGFESLNSSVSSLLGQPGPIIKRTCSNSWYDRRSR